MYFESLKILGFGCLRTEVAFKPDKVNLAVADNEAGKSTLIAALLAAFYGIVEDERVRLDKRPHRKNVLPWTEPEKFGLELYFTDGDDKWTIKRDFHEGKIALINRDSGKDMASKYHKGRGFYTIGEELIGLSCNDFLKSFYLKQEEIQDIRDAGGLTSHVQRVATAREGEATSENAVERLRQALKRYPHPESKEGISIENALKRFSTNRDSLMSDMERLARERAEIEPQALRLVSIESDITRKRADREDNQRLGDLAEIRELSRMVEAQERLQSEHDRLSAEAAALKNYAAFPHDRSDLLFKLAGRVEEISSSVAKQEAILNEIEVPFAAADAKIREYRDLAGFVAEDLVEFESAFNRLSDRRQRYRTAREERDRLAQKLEGEGFREEHFKKMRETFTALPADSIHFIEDFRVTYAEQEAAYREAKTRLDWLTRDRDALHARRSKTRSNARLFFIMAAVMVIAGGVMMLLTSGGWLGIVLAGLGGLFAAAGLIVQGSAGSVESSGLARLIEEADAAVHDEEAAAKRLDAVGSQMNSIAVKSGFSDGNVLMSEYSAFVRLEKQAEPLFESDRGLERAIAEASEALEAVHPFTNKAGIQIDTSDNILGDLRTLLKRGREAVKLGDELRSLKARGDQVAAELQRLRRDLISNREQVADILQQGGVKNPEPLDEAVARFRESLEQHRRYRSLTEDQLPRINAERLPPVDLNAKRDRLGQLEAKLPQRDLRPTDHSKEYYRDLAERTVKDIEELLAEKHSINRAIGAVLDRYQAQYPSLIGQLAEAEEQIEKAEQFRSEIETTIAIMEEISREVYRSWATALSQDAAPFLTALNPRYSDLKFAEDLSFTIQDNHTNRSISSTEVETVLSSGARDEVFLAARLGISSYLARGAKGPLPIILDEPLAAADDDKFVAAMRFFLEDLSKSHQVLIMSCHAERHRWLEKQMPKIFKSRVHNIQLASQ